MGTGQADVDGLYGVYMQSDDPTDPKSGVDDCRLEIEDMVAWLDDAESGNPFDAGNRRFLKLNFIAWWGYSPLITPILFTTLSDYSYAMGIDLELELSAGVNPSCPLYDNISETYSGGNIVMEITEWWPYSTKSGDPAWDSTTGLPLNGGPGA